MTDNHDARPSSQGGKDDAGELENMYADEILKALESENLPQFYTNSFAVNLGTGDVTVVMKRNNKQIGTIQMSYTVAKSLVEAMNELIERMEKSTGQKIMTSKFIAAKMLEDINTNDDNDVG